MTDCFALSLPALSDPIVAAFLGGAALGLGMVLSVGPRTLLLIRLGATSRQCWSAATTGYVSDMVIFLSAALLVGAALRTAPQVTGVLQMLGIGFLVWCSLRALCGPGRTPARISAVPNFIFVLPVVQMLSVTWLNPLVYLEVGLIAGSVSLGFDGAAKTAFVAGYLGAIGLKFYGWTLTGRHLAGCLMTARSLARFNILSAVMLLTMAVALAWNGPVMDLTGPAIFELDDRPKPPEIELRERGS